MEVNQKCVFWEKNKSQASRSSDAWLVLFLLAVQEIADRLCELIGFHDAGKMTARRFQFEVGGALVPLFQSFHHVEAVFRRKEAGGVTGNGEHLGLNARQGSLIG